MIKNDKKCRQHNWKLSWNIYLSIYLSIYHLAVFEPCVKGFVCIWMALTVLVCTIVHPIICIWQEGFELDVQGLQGQGRAQGGAEIVEQGTKSWASPHV